MGKPRFLSASATRIYPSPSSMSASSDSSTSNDYSQPPQVATTATSINSFSRRIRILSLVRLVLTIVSIAAAAAVIGCEAHGLDVYEDTSLDSQTWGIAPLWPIGLDIRITQAKIVAGSVVLLTALLCLVIGVVPVPHRFNLLVIFFSTGLSAIGLVGAIFGVAYTSAITRDPEYDLDNIQSWTCRWVDGAGEVNKMFPQGLADIAAPKDFKRVCLEARAGLGLLEALIGVQTIVVVATAVGAWMEVKTRKSQSQKEFVLSEKGMPDRSF